MASAASASPKATSPVGHRDTAAASAAGARGTGPRGLPAASAETGHHPPARADPPRRNETRGSGDFNLLFLFPAATATPAPSPRRPRAQRS